MQNSFLRSYRTSRSPLRCSATSGRSRPSSTRNAAEEGYQATDSIGQAGVESTYDTYLRGKDGKAQLTVDSRGRPKGAAVFETNPTPGEALRLTIDIGLQRAAERALRYGVHLAHSTFEGQHANGGAIVALSPKDGAVLAMASYPTYQPSIFVGRKDPQKLAPLLNAKVADADNHPGFNRAISVAYPPGSTFKPVTALAAMQESLMQPYDVIPCTPTFKDHGSTLQQLDAADRHGHDADDRARRVVRHVLLRARQALLQPARRPRPPAAGLGEPLRPRRDQRPRRRARRTPA